MLLVLLKKAWLLLLCAAAGFILLFMLAKFVLPRQYTSSVSMYVNNNTDKTPITNAVNINDINASQKLVNTYIVILQDDEVLLDIAQQLTESYGIEALGRMLPLTQIGGEEVLEPRTLRKIIRMSAVNNTEVLKIEAETKDAALSADICNRMTQIAPEMLQRVVKAGSVEVIGSAKAERKPSFPSVPLFSIAGLFAGFVISAAAVLLQYVMDNTVKNEEEFKKRYNIPVLGEIPDFKSEPKGGYYKSYGA